MRRILLERPWRDAETGRRQRHEGHEDRKDQEARNQSIFVNFVNVVIFVPLPSARLTASTF